MAWIESHQGIDRHPKTADLCKFMGWIGDDGSIDVDIAISKLHRLWWWCLEYAPDGCVSRHSADVYAGAVGLSADTGDKFIKALFDAKYLDKTKSGELLIHDWLEYAGRYLRDTKYKRHPEKYKEIQQLYFTIVSRQSANSRPKVRRKSAVPNQPTIPTIPTNQTVAIRLATILATCILINNPNNRELRNGNKEHTIINWSLEFDRMIKLDGENRTEKEISERIVWSQKDSFWHANILSAKAVRDKFDRLGLEMKKPNRKLHDKHEGIDTWLRETFTEVQYHGA